MSPRWPQSPCLASEPSSSSDTRASRTATSPGVTRSRSAWSRSSRSTPTSCRRVRSMDPRSRTRRSTRCSSPPSGSAPPISFRIASRSRTASAPCPTSRRSQFSAHRGRLLLALAARIRPHAVLLEGFPFVRPLQAVEECGPTLAYLSESLPETLRCAGFNGISTSLWADEHASLVERMLRERVDRLFVYVDPAERTGLLEGAPWLQRVAAKVHTTGYVVGAPPEKIGSARPDPRHVRRGGRRVPEDRPRRGGVLRVLSRPARLLSSTW